MTVVRAAAIAVMSFLWAGASLFAQEPTPPKGDESAQEDPRAKAIREAYEEQLRRERQVVTIKVRQGTVDQVVDEMRRQAGVNIVLDKRNIPEDYRVDEFVVEAEPFRNALGAFAAKAELTIDDVSPTLIRLSRPPRVTFNFRDADVKSVIDMIARVSGANIVVSPDVKGSISLSINNVPWNEVLTSVVKTLGYTTVRENFEIIRIIHPDELLKQMETRVFALKYIQPPSMYGAKVQEGQLIHGKPMTPPTQIDDMLKRFVLKQVLDTVLSKDASGVKVGRLDFDPQTNTFVVTDTKVVLDRIEEIVRLLDVEPQQVLIDVKFISTINEDLLAFGLNYSFAGVDGAGFRETILDPSTYTTVSGAAATGKFTRLPFGFGREVGTPGDQFFLTEYDMIMTFRAFKQDRFTRLIQEPTLAVIDNTEATIFVGETISYADSRATTNQFGGLEFFIGEASKSPVKVGFQLFVIPKVVPNSNKVILTIIPQNEFLSGQSGVATVPGFERFSISAAGVDRTIDLPRVSANTLVTKLMLESGRTAVLGGLVIERAVFQDKGIPVLKDIPVISYLFKQRADTIRKEHLLIFVTPRVVRGGEGPSKHLQELLRRREDAERKEYEEFKERATSLTGEEPAAPEQDVIAPAAEPAK